MFNHVNDTMKNNLVLVLVYIYKTLASYFSGMGKGLVGAFTRPASGVIDFASTTFEGVKR